MSNFFIHVDAHVGLPFKLLALDLHVRIHNEERTKETELTTDLLHPRASIVCTLNQNRKAGAEELPFLDDEGNNTLAKHRLQLEDCRKMWERCVFRS